MAPSFVSPFVSDIWVSPAAVDLELFVLVVAAGYPFKFVPDPTFDTCFVASSLPWISRYEDPYWWDACLSINPLLLNIFVHILERYTSWNIFG